MITPIVFSRDRACQLDAFLRSFYRYFIGGQLPPTPNVIWTASDDGFEGAYRSCIDRHASWVRFIRETAFRADVDRLIPDEGIVCFFTDDDILHDVAKVVDMVHEFRAEQTLAFSLRLGMNTTRCYPHDRDQNTPVFLVERAPGHVVSWSWPGADGDFGYPLSLDGHAFRATDIRHLIGNRDFTNPNQLEDVLAHRAPELADLLPRMASYSHSVLTGIPVNRVNTTHPNRVSDQDSMSAATLNSRYLSGERIILDAIDFAHVDGAHQELELVLA